MHSVKGRTKSEGGFEMWLSDRNEGSRQAGSVNDGEQAERTSVVELLTQGSLLGS